MTHQSISRSHRRHRRKGSIKKHDACIPSIRRAWRGPPPLRGRRPTPAPLCPGPRLRTARTNSRLILQLIHASHINHVLMYKNLCIYYIPGFAVVGLGRCRRRAFAGCRSPAASSSGPLQACSTNLSHRVGDSTVLQHHTAHAKGKLALMETLQTLVVAYHS